MHPGKPTKTLADLLVIGFSPVLIMLLVGSLCFFLIEVFFRGEAADSVRWVMFWFVFAVVLIARIGIEQSEGNAAIYGLGLAVAMWLYLVRVHPAPLLGAILLAIVWWCSHKLTWDCTLIDEDEDASGGGLLQTAMETKNFRLFRKKPAKVKAGKSKPKGPAKAPHPPGLWVVWFSVAAIPLFGIGQMFLPRADEAARHAGFFWLFVYVTAAIGLLLATSFLGLRRYLRQRYLVMPDMIAFGWVRFGVSLALMVLLGALLLPRPGATAAWETLGYQVNYRLHEASDYAARFGPHGSGPGWQGETKDNSALPDNSTDPNGKQKTPGQSPEKTTDRTGHDEQSPSVPPSPPGATSLFKWLRALFFLALLMLGAWWLWRYRTVLLSMWESFLAALRNFFNDLFHWGGKPETAAAVTAKTIPKRNLFSTYRNPFLLGDGSSWTPEQLVLYSYEALQAWAGERGVEPRPEQTAREFCAEISSRFPEITDELNGLSRLYAHAAYGNAVPPGQDLEPVKRVWRYFGV